jgi:hypothetical protein
MTAWKASLGAAAVIGAMIISTPMNATAAGPKQVALQEKTQHGDDVETRINTLHRELKITPQQEQAWGAVAQQMRDNAKARADVHARQTASENTATAPDMISAYAKTAEVQAEAAQKFARVFQPLYDGMSDQQKKTADAVFQEKVHDAARKARS